MTSNQTRLTVLDFYLKAILKLYKAFQDGSERMVLNFVLIPLGKPGIFLI